MLCLAPLSNELATASCSVPKNVLLWIFLGTTSLSSAIYSQLSESVALAKRCYSSFLCGWLARFLMLLCEAWYHVLVIALAFINSDVSITVWLIVRYTIVLQIFWTRARTKEAKLQVALAEVPYYRFVSTCKQFWYFDIHAATQLPAYASTRLKVALLFAKHNWPVWPEVLCRSLPVTENEFSDRPTCCTE